LINPRYTTTKIYDKVNEFFEANNFSRQKVNHSLFKPRTYENNNDSWKSLDSIIKEKGIQTQKFLYEMTETKNVKKPVILLKKSNDTT